jgi:plasmid stabilization system protein ParE
MLPARSWQKMMANLGQHFGDDATVDPQTAAKITDYLVRNAADSETQQYGRKFLRGLEPASTPLRITELPKWLREHRKVKESEWRRPEVRSKANCVACHRGAEAGDFGD